MWIESQGEESWAKSMRLEAPGPILSPFAPLSLDLLKHNYPSCSSPSCALEDPTPLLFQLCTPRIRGLPLVTRLSTLISFSSGALGQKLILAYDCPTATVNHWYFHCLRGWSPLADYLASWSSPPESTYLRLDHSIQRENMYIFMCMSCGTILLCSHWITMDKTKRDMCIFLWFLVGSNVVIYLWVRDSTECHLWRERYYKLAIVP